MKKLRIVMFVVIGCGILFVAACDGGTGVCVSSAVEYQNIGLRVYCYDDWDKSECEDYDKQQVNGADWFFHSGQTCSDRGLSTGSNPWP